MKFIVGVYVGNNNYFGKETRLTNEIEKWGVQWGMEYEIIKDKLYFQADFISGHTSMSNLIAGGAYKVTKQLVLSAGYQLPNAPSESSEGLIFELTYLP